MRSESLTFCLKLTPGCGLDVGDALSSPPAHEGSLKVVSGCGLDVDDALSSPPKGSLSSPPKSSLKVAPESKLEVEDALDDDAASSGVKVEVGDRGEPGLKAELRVGVELGELLVRSRRGRWKSLRRWKNKSSRRRTGRWSGW